MFLNGFLRRIYNLFNARNRRLLVELTRAEMKLRDHHTLSGLLWSIVGPATLLFAMYMIFKDRFGQGIDSYILYLLIGIVCVNFFITSTNYLMTSIAGNRNHILSTTIPREHVLISNLCVHLYKFLIELAICLVLSFYFHIFSWKTAILMVPLLAAYILFVLGIGFVFSLGYCFSRDLAHLWMIASRLIYFVTPVFFNLSSVSKFAQHVIYWFNPLTPFLLSFRDILMGQGTVHFATYWFSLFLAGLFLILGYSFFIYFEPMAVERS